MIEDTAAVEQFRLPVAAHYKGRCNGAFRLPSPLGGNLNVIVSDGDEMEYFLLGIHGPRWEHASVSLAGMDRLPTWEEMCTVKRTFWKPTETVLQFHPLEAEYVNTNPNVLHLWRLVGENHPLPQKVLV